MEQPTSALDLLREPRFRTLWATVELSFLGMFIHMVACSWVMTALTSSATLVSLIQTAYSLPIVLFAVVAGAMADTLDRRRTMVVSLGLSLIGSLGLVAAARLDLLTPWSMLGLMFVVGTGVAIFTPSWQASLGEIVSRDRLADAVSLHNMGANVMRTLGPSLGGMLVAAASAGTAFAVGALTYIPATLALLFWRPERKAQEDTPEALWPAVMSGLRFLIAAPHLQTLLLRVFCFAASAISVMALLPLVARQQLGLGVGSYGLLFGSFGLGAIGGGIASSRFRQRLGSEKVVRAAFVINAASIGLLAISQNFWLAILASVISGSCWLTGHSIQNSTLQLATPRWIVGRMVAMFLSAAFCGLSVGGWVWGVAAERLGTQGALGLSSAAMICTALLALRFPMPSTQGLDLNPLQDRTSVVALPPLHPDTGPLQVQIEHRLAPGALPRFETLMEKRRAHLSQLGARNWTLMHDLAAGEAWIETFRVASWSDYQRLMFRRTNESLSLRQELLSLQNGQAKPVVRVLLMARRARQVAEPMLRA